jgi:hypothetical protein
MGTSVVRVSRSLTSHISAAGPRVAVTNGQMALCFAAEAQPRECWIPVPFPAPVGSAPNFLRRFQDREKAQLPQAFADEAWGFASGTLRQIALQMPICLRRLRVGHFTLQAFSQAASVA